MFRSKSLDVDVSLRMFRFKCWTDLCVGISINSKSANMADFEFCDKIEFESLPIWQTFKSLGYSQPNIVLYRNLFRLVGS